MSANSSLLQGSSSTIHGLRPHAAAASKRGHNQGGTSDNLLSGCSNGSASQLLGNQAHDSQSRCLGSQCDYMQESSGQHIFSRSSKAGDTAQSGSSEGDDSTAADKRPSEMLAAGAPFAGARRPPNISNASRNITSDLLPPRRGTVALDNLFQDSDKEDSSDGRALKRNDDSDGRSPRQQMATALDATGDNLPSSTLLPSGNAAAATVADATTTPPPLPPLELPAPASFPPLPPLPATPIPPLFINVAPAVESRHQHEESHSQQQPPPQQNTALAPGSAAAASASKQPSLNDSIHSSSSKSWKAASASGGGDLHNLAEKKSEIISDYQQLLAQTSADISAFDARIPVKSKPFLRCGNTLVMNQHETSLFCFSGDAGGVRHFLFDMYDHWIYHFIISLLVLFNVLVLIFKSPNITGSGTDLLSDDAVFYIDIGLQVVYTLEIIGKIIVLGFAFHPHSFCRDPSDVLDVVVVAGGYAALFLSTTTVGAGLRTLKILRMQRILHVLQHAQVVRAIFMTLVSSARRMCDVIALLIFVVFGFSVLGLQLFVAAFSKRCYFQIARVPDNVSSAATELVLDPAHAFGCTSDLDAFGGHFCNSSAAQVCVVDPAQSQVRFLNFDNIGNSMYSVLQLLAVDSFHLTVRRMQYSTGLYYGIFAVLLVLCGSFFALNLVLGVLSAQYELTIRLLREEDEEKQQEKEQQEERERNRVYLDMMATATTDSQQRAITGEYQRTMRHIRRQRGKAEKAKLKLFQLLPDPSDSESSDDDEQQQGHGEADDALSSSAASIDRDAAAAAAATAAPGDANVEEEGKTRRKKNKKTRKGNAAKEEREEDESEDLPCCKRFFKCIAAARSWFDKSVMNSIAVTVFSVVVTLINVGALAAAHHGMSTELETVLDWINFVCGAYFIVEIIIFFIARGFKIFTDGIFIFDMMLAGFTVAEFVVVGPSATGTSWAALRGLRILRVLRLGGKVPQLRKLFATIALAAKAATAVFAVLFLYIFVFALFSVFLFANLVSEAKKLDPALASYVRPRFDSLSESLLAHFVLLTGEAMGDSTAIFMTGSSAFAGIYFFAYFWIGNKVLLNLVVALLIVSFSEAQEMDHHIREEEQRQAAAEAELSLIQAKLEAGAEVEKDGVGGEEKSNYKNLTLLPPSDVDAADDDSKRYVTAIDMGTAEKKKTTEDDVNVNNNNNNDTNNISGNPATAVRLTVSISDVAETSADGAQRSPTQVHARDDFGCETAPPQEQQQQQDQNNNNHSMSGPATGSSSVHQRKMLVIRERPQDGWMQQLADFLGVPEYDTIAQRLQGDSFFCFGPDNCLRVQIAEIVAHPIFELIVLLVILESVIAVGFDNNRARSTGGNLLASFLWWNNVAVCVLFGLEALLKMFAFGVVLHEGSYLREPFNIFDFCIVGVSILSIFVEASSLMVLRTFRLAAKWKAMRTVLESLARAVPGIMNVIFAFVLTLFTFAVIGTHLFLGEFVTCSDPAVTARVNCTGTWNRTIWNATFPSNGSEYLSRVSVNEPRRWQFAFYNFNDVANSMLTVLMVFFGDGWAAILYNGMGAKSFDTAIDPNGDRSAAAVFMILVVVVGNFFIMQLFIGSLMSSFKQQQDYLNGIADEEGRALLTDEQQAWIRSYKFVSATSLPQHTPRPEWAVRRFVCWIWFSDRFRKKTRPATEFFFSLLIVTTVAFMASEHDGQSAQWSETLTRIDIGLNCAFALESLLCLIALRPMCFLADSWNIFNVVLVVTAFCSSFFNGPGLNAIRVARVARLLRLIPRAKGLQRMFNTLVYSLPELANISVLLLLVLYMFGVIGTQLFEFLYIDYTGTEGWIFTEMFNFEHPGVAMVTLFQAATSSGWSDVLYSATAMTPQNSGCNYADAQLGTPNTCGRAVSIPFFIGFMIVTNCVMLNLFVFVIVEQYLQVKELQSVRIEWLLASLRHFRENWAQLDLERERFLRFDAVAICYRKMLVQERRCLHDFREELDVPVVVLRGPTREVLVCEVLASHAVPTVKELELEMTLHYLQDEMTAEVHAGRTYEEEMEQKHDEAESHTKTGEEEMEDEAPSLAAHTGSGNNSKSSNVRSRLDQVLEGAALTAAALNQKQGKRDEELERRKMEQQQGDDSGGIPSVGDYQRDLVAQRVSRVFLPSDAITNVDDDDVVSNAAGATQAQRGRRNGDPAAPTRRFHHPRDEEPPPDPVFFLKRMKSLHIPVLRGGLVAYEDCVFALTRFHLGCGEMSHVAYKLLQRVHKFTENHEELQLHQALVARKLLLRFRAAKRKRMTAGTPESSGGTKLPVESQRILPERHGRSRAAETAHIKIEPAELPMPHVAAAAPVSMCDPLRVVAQSSPAALNNNNSDGSSSAHTMDGSGESSLNNTSTLAQREEDARRIASFVNKVLIQPPPQRTTSSASLPTCAQSAPSVPDSLPSAAAAVDVKGVVDIEDVDSLSSSNEDGVVTRLVVTGNSGEEVDSNHEQEEPQLLQQQHQQQQDPAAAVPSDGSRQVTMPGMVDDDSEKSGEPFSAESSDITGIKANSQRQQRQQDEEQEQHLHEQSPAVVASEAEDKKNDAVPHPFDMPDDNNNDEDMLVEDASFNSDG